MKKESKGNAASTPLSSPAGSRGMWGYHDYQMGALKMYPGNGHATETASHNTRHHVKEPNGTGKLPDSQSQDAKYKVKDKSVNRNTMWMMDSSSQDCSGPHENSTDLHETLTEASTLTFLDAHIKEDSADNHSFNRVGMAYLKEFVLIDDDDDGDMSLREKTVTDISVMDGNAADLVCGRLFTTSSDSLSEDKEECLAPEAPPTKEVQTSPEKRCCCFCTLS
ncbi:paralemmin-2 [Echeneis naucrates]|uniref:paralemmin-2 n=1 Tax=Echeneis naucrates TaxID=173247 RepID=UPI00111439A0|nr:paralemmin-2-like [Echeneis naucrates]